ncbi:Fc.00g109210.m01.CDS01 [Cosmosporella sp. VM-42]
MAETSRHDPKSRVSVSSVSSGTTEARADEDIPPFFRKFVEKYPFGNVHMALRVGPLVIQNGVSQGALISLREMPVFHDRFQLQSEPDRDLALGGDSGRSLWERKRQIRDPKRLRYKAIMKQVAEVPFSHVLPLDAELAIVEDLLEATRLPFDDPGLPTSDQRSLLDSALQPVLEKVKSLLRSRVKVYLESITQHLLFPFIKLKWSATRNNCQTFCNSIISSFLFEPLVNGLSANTPDGCSPLAHSEARCTDTKTYFHRIALKLSLHLARDRHMYAPGTIAEEMTAAGHLATPESWMRNRLAVLTASSILHRAAAAMAWTPEFCKATAWLHGRRLLGQDLASVRVKLGGIHRAQPFSHCFEAKTYRHYFLAPWAIFPRQEQVEAYELLRDGRVKLPDVPVSAWTGRFAWRDTEKSSHEAIGFPEFLGAPMVLKEARPDPRLLELLREKLSETRTVPLTWAGTAPGISIIIIIIMTPAIMTMAIMVRRVMAAFDSVAVEVGIIAAEGGFREAVETVEAEA